MELIPKPLELKKRPGELLLDRHCRITLDTSCGEEALLYAGFLAEELKNDAGLELMIDRRNKGEGHPGIRLVMEPEAVSERLQGKEEAYELQILEKMAVVRAVDRRGLLAGVQTLRQLIRLHGALLPCLEILDYPKLPVRGWFMDVTRGRVPKLSYLKEMVDRCSLYKINQLHLYVEHTFLFDGFSEVWRDDTPLTAQDILELDQYCADRGIDLVPSVATFGHLYKVLRTKTFEGLSEVDDEREGTEFSFYGRMCHHTLNVTDERSLQLVCQMIDEYASLFRSKLFNINCDETFDLGKGRGRARAEEIGVHGMYLEWVNRVCEHIRAIGKRPMFWGDIIAAHPETIRQLPQDIICMNWDYGLAKEDTNVRKLWENGAHQYLCPGVQGWNQTIHLLRDAYLNIRKMAEFAHRFEGEGLLVTDWGDYGHIQYPELALIGIIYGAAMGWSEEMPKESELNAAISRLEYQDPSGQAVELLRGLSLQAVYHWGELVQFVEEYRFRISGHGLAVYWKNMEERAGQHLTHLRQVNEAIDAKLCELYRLLPQIGETSRRRLAPVALMADGQKLLNALLSILAEVWIGKGEAIMACEELAGELESWYYEYRRLWRRDSRESELYRIGETIFWIADYLRRLPEKGKEAMGPVRQA